MRYAGGYDSNRPWNDSTNPLRLRYSEPWRLGTTPEFNGGSMEGLFPTTTETSDYLYGTGFDTEVSRMGKRGYIEPYQRQMTTFAEASGYSEATEEEWFDGE